MTQMYKLCSEQLSQQDHYDFGMRAVKSVLVMAGGLKRKSPGVVENIVLICALRDSNLPKFLNDDAILFQAILQDLFPGVVIPENVNQKLQTAIENVTRAKGLQVVEKQTIKVVQLLETMIVRHGVMLVGPTGGGKTVVYQVLADTCKVMYDNMEDDAFYQPVHMYVMNPKSITMGELYGDYNKLTMEWQDGLMGITIRHAVNQGEKTADHQWVVCDGPVDALWIENMNTVLDDNKMLCLANSERIKFTPYIHMIFEVQDLAVASPATVSRCGMVYVDPDELKWMPTVLTWSEKACEKLKPEIKEQILDLFRRFVDAGLNFVQKKCTQDIMQVNISKVVTLCLLLETLLCKNPEFEQTLDPPRLKSMVGTVFAFCYLWAIGGNVKESNRDQVDSFIKSQFDDYADAKLPSSGALWNYFMDFKMRRMDTWEKMLPSFIYNASVPFFEVLVPTEDTICYGYLFGKLAAAKRSVLFTGNTGVGKSVVARGTLLNLSTTTNIIPVFINFSAQTSSGRTQEMIEAKMLKKRKNILGAPAGKRLIIFVDDLNMPRLDTYGSQPPIELMRQYQDFGGFYDRESMHWKELKDMTISAACAPPGGGRNPITPRFIRHFSILSLPAPAESSIQHMFTLLLDGFFYDYPHSIRSLVRPLVSAAKEIYARLSNEFRPTPAKSHYIFNLRDLSKCMQGLLQCDINSVKDNKGLYRLFCHEALRVFHDRLTNFDDKNTFYQMLSELSIKYFNQSVEAKLFASKPILFGDFARVGAAKEDRLYQELPEISKIRTILQDYMFDYTTDTAKEIKLVFFMDAIEHLTRIARIIRQERGNGLLVGVGGCGKQSLTKLASFISSYKCFQIEIGRGYDYTAFHDDLKKLYDLTGIQNLNTVFLFTDTQIVVEEFLEDINNILNSGEVPNLFENDEIGRNIVSVRPAAVASGIPDGNRDAIYEYFINRVRKNLHIVLCMSPVGSAFRSRCRMFPSLVNCCTIDWFTEWPKDALLSVANSAFAEIDIASDEIKNKLAIMCMEVHLSVNDTAALFYTELKRYYYTTPTSYLELLNLYLQIIIDRKRKINMHIMRIKNGLQKLKETNIVIDKMKTELIMMEPILAAKTEKSIQMTATLEVDQNKADAVRRVVKEEEALALQKASETKAIASDAHKDLNEALPALEGAIKALDALDKSDISEIRVFTKPPELVQTVMEAVCILLNAKTDWASAKQVLGDSNFLKKLFEYDKDNINESTLKKLKKYIDNPKFTPEAVEKVSRACRSLCLWVRAIDLYAHIFKTVEPKRKKLAEAQVELEIVMRGLKEKQTRLAEVEAQIDILQEAYQQTYNEKMQLEEAMELARARLSRAGKLTAALGDEKIRWEETISNLTVQLNNVIGDVFISAAAIAYYGAFTSVYRQELVSSWTKRCLDLAIPVTDNMSVVSVLVDNEEIRQWNADGLPRDDVSVENGMLVTRSRRWPLMIDPQEQAKRWIKMKETGKNLKVAKMTDSSFMQVLKNCIRLGYPMLLEDIGELLDPSMEPILLKQTFVSGGRMLIRLGDNEVEYSKDFRLYMTTKLANPHYLPEVCIKVTIINFTVTKLGLENQLLSEVSSLERPDLESQRTHLIMKINMDKTQMKNIEDRTLKLLFESEGNILDNEELINTLNDSKKTSTMIMERLKEAEMTEQKISASRELYRVVAIRGSVLYFVVASMAEVDPMYQFSLKYFKMLFTTTIKTSEPSNDLQTRLNTLLNKITASIYRNVSRALFEKDKLVFSFMLCVEIKLSEGVISPIDWTYFIRGGVVRDTPAKPALDWLTADHWREACLLEAQLPAFAGIQRDITIKPVCVKLGSVLSRANPFSTTDYEEKYQAIRSVSDLSMRSQELVVPGLVRDGEEVNSAWNEKLTQFQKLIFIKAFSEDKVTTAIRMFVVENLGHNFVEPPKTDLPTLFADMTNITPLIFVLSTGTDPMAAFLRFAKEKEFLYRVKAISLGQGQGPVAEKLLRVAFKAGDWIFLQNCHLAASWMLSLEEIVKEMSESTGSIHSEFRLFLSSMPTSSFPVSVLQNSVKVTNEPPKGLRSNLKRSFTEMTKAFFEENELGISWCRMLFSICLFHAVVLERKKFGPLGWNIKYEFADSDRECALMNLQMYCQEGNIPWDTLTYITGEITYGGRVTDKWDQRCMKTVLHYLFSAEILKEDYVYSPSGVYYAPLTNNLEEYRQYVDSLPSSDNPEIFGMHDNANIAYQVQETNRFIETLLEMQPRTSGGSAAQSADNIVFELAAEILDHVSLKLDLDLIKPTLIEPDKQGNINSLTTVLIQEVTRFNKLLGVIRRSLKQLQDAIKGLVVMSEALEQVYYALLNNQVPTMWAQTAYPSLKPLASWVKDLVLRCKFVHAWVITGPPKTFWLPGFFFPQGFLTGVLQNCARKYFWPVDQLSFKYALRNKFYDQAQLTYEREHNYWEEGPLESAIVPPTDGVLVHGLFMDGFRWDGTLNAVEDSYHGVMMSPLPVLEMGPAMDYVVEDNLYASPLYKTSLRAGVLSTTGHSTNFVVTVYLPSKKPQDYWIRRGSALLCQIST